MAQSFYTKWQYVFLADAGCYVSREYRNFQTALVREISKYAKAVDAAVVAKTKGHYFTSCFVERNGKFVYINHSSGLSRRIGSVRIELDSFLIRTARHAEDYTGGTNQYCDLLRLQSMIDRDGRQPLPVPFFSGRHPFVFRPKTSNRRKTTKTTRICIGKAAGGAGKPADSLLYRGGYR